LINDQIIAITQQTAKLRSSLGDGNSSDAVDELKSLENTHTQVSEVLIPF
jgi:hypothetical protein